jgi:beta-barrel assembly-enhancing protease
LASFQGIFNDGRSAARHEVEVRIGTDSLTLVFDEGDVQSWPLDSIDIAEEVYPGQPIRLKHAVDSEARLTVEDPAFLEALIRVAPQFSGRASPSRRMWRGAIIGILCAGVTGVLVFLGLPWLASLSATVVPLAWEEDMGDRIVGRIAAATSTEEHKFCRDPSGLMALEELIGRLSDAADSTYRFRVRVIASPMVNAFAAPGGQIVVMSGLIKKADTSEEVAGVLAHEMGHVIGRHPTEGMIRHIGLSVILDAISGGVIGTGALSGFAETLIALSYNREAEREADRTAEQILSRARISKRGLVRFFERLRQKEEKGVRVPAILSSHPPTEGRESRFRSGDDSGTAAMDEDAWQAIRKVCGN